jgi:hypothetical protein
MMYNREDVNGRYVNGDKCQNAFAGRINGLQCRCMSSRRPPFCFTRFPYGMPLSLGFDHGDVIGYEQHAISGQSHDAVHYLQGATCLWGDADTWWSNLTFFIVAALVLTIYDHCKSVYDHSADSCSYFVKKF